MTTIAYKDNTIAYDSRETLGDFISNDNKNKKFKIGKTVFFFSGIVSDIEPFLRTWVTGESPGRQLEINALVVEDGKVYFSSVCEDGNLAVSDFTGSNFAIGSGAQYAIGAMDAGCTAKEAVKIALGRDANSGGKIKTHKIK